MVTWNDFNNTNLYALKHIDIKMGYNYNFRLITKYYIRIKIHFLFIYSQQEVILQRWMTKLERENLVYMEIPWVSGWRRRSYCLLGMSPPAWEYHTAHMHILLYILRTEFDRERKVQKRLNTAVLFSADTSYSERTNLADTPYSENCFKLILPTVRKKINWF